MELTFNSTTTSSATPATPRDIRLFIHYDVHQTEMLFKDVSTYDNIRRLIRDDYHLKVAVHDIILFTDPPSSNNNAPRSPLDPSSTITLNNNAHIYFEVNSQPQPQPQLKAQDIQGLIRNLLSSPAFKVDVDSYHQRSSNQTEVKLVDRERALIEFKGYIVSMHAAFEEDSEIRYNHSFIGCMTGSGMGKTTFGTEAPKCIKLPNNMPFVQIFIDFNGGGDGLTMSDVRTDGPSLSLCKRIFARGVLGIPFNLLDRHHTLSSEDYKLLNLSSLFSYIADRRRAERNLDSNQPIAIFLHIDEFPLANKFACDANEKNFVKNMMYSLGEYRCRQVGQDMSQAKQDNVFLIPILTGTTVQGFEIRFTQYYLKPISLHPLTVESSIKILINHVGDYTIFKDPRFRILVGDLGVVPRYLHYLIDSIKFYNNTVRQKQVELEKKVEFDKALGCIQKHNDPTPLQMSFLDSLKDVAAISLLGVDVWLKIGQIPFESSPNMLVELIMLSISGSNVTWGTKIGDFAIEEIAFSGLIILSRTPNTPPQYFQIFLPIVLLNKMCSFLKLNDLLKGTAQYPYLGASNGTSFESAVHTILWARINLLASSSGPHMLSSVFPGATGAQSLAILVEKIILSTDRNKWISGEKKSMVIDKKLETPFNTIILCCPNNNCFDMRVAFKRPPPDPPIIAVIQTKITDCGKYFEKKYLDITKGVDLVKEGYPLYNVVPVVISNYKMAMKPNDLWYYDEYNIELFVGQTFLHRLSNLKREFVNLKPTVRTQKQEGDIDEDIVSDEEMEEVDVNDNFYDGETIDATVDYIKLFIGPDQFLK